MLGLTAGARPQDLGDARLWRQMVKLRMSLNDPSKMAGQVLDINGVEVAGADLARILTEGRVYDNSLSIEAAAQAVNANKTILDLPDRVLRRSVGPFFRANQIMQDVNRSMVFMSFLRQGDDATTASQRTIRALFDYADFTKVEDQIFRRLFPFYSWMRNNLGYQIAMLAERPGFAALTPKIQEALEQVFAGEAQVPQNQRPMWMRDAVATQMGSDPNSRFALMLGTTIPQGEVFNVLAPLFGREGAMKFMHYFVSGLAPTINVPLQVGAGTEFFSGRSISPDVYSGDMGVGEFLANQIRPVAEVGRFARAFEQGGVPQVAARTFFGGRIQAMDDDRISSSLRREFRSEEERIRYAVRKAERNGDSSASTEARARLLDLYRDAVRRGMDDIVPKWAREQLSLAASGA